ncbi:adenine/guanine phosphoribosyltransferase, partial [Proteus mirabilis]
TDNYGLGIPNFVYNVAHQQFDRILLCCETPAESIDSQLIEALYKVAPIVEVISYD